MMLTFSLRASKLLTKQIKLCRGSFSTVKFLSDESEFTDMICYGGKKNQGDFTRNETFWAMKLIHNPENPSESVDWGGVVRKLKDHKVQNPYAKILHACARLNKPNLGLDFHKYLVEKNEQLSKLDLIFFCKLLQQDKKQIKNFENLLINLYKDVRDSLMTSSVIRFRVLHIFVAVPRLFEDIVQDARMSIKFANKAIVLKAFQINQPEIAYEFMNDNDFILCSEFLEVFINYLINRAKDGSFTPEMITRLIDLCGRKCLKIPTAFDPHLLKTLVKVLNRYCPDYVWSVNKGQIQNKTGVCSNCNLALLPKTISESEWEKLKSHFWEKALKNQNIYLSSTKAEVEKFLNFLKTCKPYDLVIDGLNIFYLKKNTGTPLWDQYINYFLEKGLNVLVIAKVHAQKSFTKVKKINKKHLHQIQFFFVENVSKDDLFILYAALYRNLDTYVFSGDFLFNHSSNFNGEMRNLFQKWLLSHHYLLIPGSPPLPPMPHCGLSQLTYHSKEKYVWHLGRLSGKKKLSTVQDMEWYCLEASKKYYSDAILKTLVHSK